MIVTDWPLLCSMGYQGGGSIFNGKGKPITKGYGTLWQEHIAKQQPKRRRIDPKHALLTKEFKL